MLEIGKTYKLKETSNEIGHILGVEDREGLYSLTSQSISIPFKYIRVLVIRTGENILGASIWLCKVWDVRDSSVNILSYLTVAQESLITEWRGEPLDADQHQGEIWNPYADGGKGAWRFL